MERNVRMSKSSSTPEPGDVSLRQSLPVPAQYRRTLRRSELRQMVPLADTTIYEMERRGDFPRRFNLTARCVVWDLAEVEAWLAERRLASEQAQIKRAPSPDVRQRKTRPVKSPVSS
jgi:prophage regulatory protein